MTRMRTSGISRRVRCRRRWLLRASLPPVVDWMILTHDERLMKSPSSFTPRDYEERFKMIKVYCTESTTVVSKVSRWLSREVEASVFIQV